MGLSALKKSRGNLKGAGMIRLAYRWLLLAFLSAGVLLAQTPEKLKIPDSRTPGGVQSRSGPLKIELLKKYGGTPESETAVTLGLDWLAKHQAPDGRWALGEFPSHGQCRCGGIGGVKNDVAATAFGLLPYLGAGYTHKSEDKRYARLVEKATKYLLSRQTKTGEIDSLMYAHGLAAIALTELYAMTHDEMLKEPSQRALDYICKAQSNEGGWRYKAGTAGFDSSIGGWQLMALKTGQLAGLTVPEDVYRKAVLWLDEAHSDNGHYGYCSKGEKTPATTAIGLLCRQYLGDKRDNDRTAKGITFLEETGPRRLDMYFIYYATQAMRHRGGDRWEKWNKSIRDELIRTQDNGTGPVKHLKGSWYDERGAHLNSGGRVMATSLSILTLEVYYRHVPLY